MTLGTQEPNPTAVEISMSAPCDDPPRDVGRGGYHQSERMIEWRGETLSVSGWAERLCVTRATLSERIKAHGLVLAMSFGEHRASTRATGARPSRAPTKEESRLVEVRMAEQTVAGVIGDIDAAIQATADRVMIARLGVARDKAYLGHRLLRSVLGKNRPLGEAVGVAQGTETAMGKVTR